MECAVHPDVTTTQACSTCKKPSCDRCLTYEVDGRAVCESCGSNEDERSNGFGSALLAFVGVGYLAALAIGYLVFHARPFVGGLAAVVAIALGRGLQLWLKPSVVTRR